MANFEYQAVDPHGNAVSGQVEATDRSAAVKTLIDQKLKPVSLKESKGQAGGLGSMSLFGANKVKNDDLVVFTRQLAAMVGAGVPLLRALTSLADHTESQALKKVLTEVIHDVQSGATLADALGKHPRVFSSVYVNMVKAGEAAGILEEILRRLALQQEKNASIRKKIKSAMTYPTVLVCIMTLAFFGLMLFVIPQIGKIVTDLGGPDAELPLLTQIMLGISHFMVNFWFILIPAFIGAIVLLLRYLRTPGGRSKLHHLTLKIPAIKTIVMKVAMARFARIYSALIGAGVPVLEALDVTARALGNVVYEEALLKAGVAVKEGATLSSVIEKNELFPAIIPQMLAVGEETGQTDVVLVKVADFYEEEVDTAINSLSSIIEPLMIVIMGATVGLIAASVMLPIAGLANQIKA